MQVHYLYVSLKNPPPPDINSGDTLYLSAVIYPVANDFYPADNYFMLNQAVVNSYDPNDKSESHGAGITPEDLANGEYLYYTIRFQNTGNYPASIIKIIDTLSDKLDWTTLEVLTNSHNLEFKVEDGRYLTWWSNNFYLPDSTSNEQGSNGYVSYRIKPKAGMQPTDVILNTAHIYLDYNPPIPTNTVTTQILQERITRVPVKAVVVKSIQLYPYPAENAVTMKFNAVKDQPLYIKAFDLAGNELYNEKANAAAGENEFTINLAGFAKGMYMIKLIDEKKVLYYGKVLKQ
jgi:uncharacterized repeat protein (TIGR01451 family)